MGPTAERGGGQWNRRGQVHRTVASVHLQVLPRGTGGQRGQVQGEHVDVDEGQAQPPQCLAASQRPHSGCVVASMSAGSAPQCTAGGQRHQIRHPDARVEDLECGARSEWLKAGDLQQ